MRSESNRHTLRPLLRRLPSLSAYTHPYANDRNRTYNPLLSAGFQDRSTHRAVHVGIYYYPFRERARQDLNLRRKFQLICNQSRLTTPPHAHYIPFGKRLCLDSNQRTRRITDLADPQLKPLAHTSKKPIHATYSSDKQERLLDKCVYLINVLVIQSYLLSLLIKVFMGRIGFEPITVEFLKYIIYFMSSVHHQIVLTARKY